MHTMRDDSVNRKTYEPEWSVSSSPGASRLPVSATDDRPLTTDNSFFPTAFFTRRLP